MLFSNTDQAPLSVATKYLVVFDHKDRPIPGVVTFDSEKMICTQRTGYECPVTWFAFLIPAEEGDNTVEILRHILPEDMHQYVCVAEEPDDEPADVVVDQGDDDDDVVAEDDDENEQCDDTCDEDHDDDYDDDDEYDDDYDDEDDEDDED